MAGNAYINHNKYPLDVFGSSLCLLLSDSSSNEHKDSRFIASTLVCSTVVSIASHVPFFE